MRGRTPGQFSGVIRAGAYLKVMAPYPLQALVLSLAGCTKYEGVRSECLINTGPPTAVAVP